MRKLVVTTAFVCLAALLTAWVVTGCERLGEEPTTTGEQIALGPGRYDSSILPIADSPLRGDYRAPVTVALFADFNLPESLQAAQLVDEVVSDERLADQVRVVIKPVPGRGEMGEPLVSAMFFAAQQGRFWGAFYDKLIESSGDLDDEGLRALLVQSGLDVDQFDRLIEEGLFRPAIEANRMLARTLRTGRSSAVVVNGYVMREVNADQLRDAVATELEEVHSLAESGVADSELYARRVLENAPRRDRRLDRGRRDRLEERMEAQTDRQGAMEILEGTGAELTRRLEGLQRPATEDREARMAAAQPPANDVERLNIPIGDSYSLGPEDAPVTIVAFNDFHCPYSRRGTDTVRQLIEEYGDDVRLVFKHNPLPMHPESPLAHQAVMAAGAQGKFWEMHDLVFENQRARSREDLEGFAQQLGLDMDQFRAFLDQNQGSGAIEADQEMARRAQARGTPHFFINGRRLPGAQPVERFQEVIDSELALANRLMEQGSERGAVYDAIMSRAQDAPEVAAEPEPPAPQSREERLAAATPPPENTERMRVPIGDSYVLGPEDALVTIVAFNDFHCPYSRRGASTVSSLVEEYGPDVRIVFKNNPLPMHPESPMAHEAALAAGAQGKFWEMHDLIFENQRARSRDDLLGFAQQLELDMDTFTSFLDAEQASAQIASDQELGGQVGARGTPHFFINGRRLRGAQPVERFYDVIDSEIALANQLIEQGVARNQLYEHLMEGALEEAPQTARPERADPPSRVDLPPIGDAPTLGPDNAPITIFMYDEFQCPYCRRAETTLQQVRDTYGDQVRFVWRDFPLPFHSNAELAAQAAYAAGEQGKFWEMHDLLFENQRAIARPDLERYAEQLGLDIDQFRQTLDENRFSEQIQNSINEGRQLGVSGTPTFFINGERLVGAVPFERFQAIIQRQLAED